ncbi:MAG TPA: glycine cleavage system protein GcvH [Methylophilaceae bacterium]|jgi:glycine cleavage system H protein
MKIPENLSYSTEHLWVQLTEDGSCLAGITDYAQDLLGDIVFVELPTIGAPLTAGVACGLVESVKTGSDLHAPLDGTVETVNSALENTPELINDKPYETWIFRFRPSNAADLKSLLSPVAYGELLGNTN